MFAADFYHVTLTDAKDGWHLVCNPERRDLRRWTEWTASYL